MRRNKFIFLRSRNSRERQKRARNENFGPAHAEIRSGLQKRDNHLRIVEISTAPTPAAWNTHPELIASAIVCSSSANPITKRSDQIISYFPSRVRRADLSESFSTPSIPEQKRDASAGAHHHLSREHPRRNECATHQRASSFS